MLDQKDIALERQEEILRQFQSGDTEIFSEIYDMYYESIFKFVLRRVGNSHTAYDLTAEVFLKAFESFQKFKWQGISFKTWLYRIANNKLKNYYRGQKVMVHPIDEVPEGCYALMQDALLELQEAEEELMKNEQSREVRAYISKLKPHYQQVVGLRYSAGLSLKEIAHSMNISESAVKSILHRAHKKLRVLGLEALLVASVLFFILLIL